MCDAEGQQNQRRASVMNVADQQKVAFARVQRNRPTPGERRLWRALRSQKLGAKFRRQHPIGDFVLDFYCAEARLAIEVDGDVHEYQTEYDRWRDSQLAEQGIEPLRFREERVIDQLPRVLDAIRRAVRARFSGLTPGPSPSLASEPSSRRGE